MVMFSIDGGGGSFGRIGMRVPHTSPANEPQFTLPKALTPKPHQGGDGALRDSRSRRFGRRYGRQALWRVPEVSVRKLHATWDRKHPMRNRVPCAEREGRGRGARRGVVRCIVRGSGSLAAATRSILCQSRLPCTLSVRQSE